jgi:hypothetical protein
MHAFIDHFYLCFVASRYCIMRSSDHFTSVFVTLFSYRADMRELSMVTEDRFARDHMYIYTGGSQGESLVPPRTRGSKRL